MKSILFMYRQYQGYYEKKNKDLKGGDIDFQYANNVVAVKWLDKRGVTMVGACLEEYNKVSTM